MAAAIALAGGVAASCTFSPGPEGSALNAPGQPGTSTSGNPFGGGSGTSGSGSGGNGSSGPPPSPDGKNCGLQQYGLQNVPPDLLIVLDRSGSMNHQYNEKTCPRMGTCVQKWPDMQKGLTMVVDATTATIRWGVKYFPQDDASQSCAADGPPAVAPANGSGTATSTSINMTMATANGATPTAPAIMSAATYLGGLTDPNPKYILLATDGMPNCNNGDPGADDNAGAVAAVAASFGAGIPVYVVGIGTVTSAIDTLNKMADAGGRPRMSATDPTTHYYPVGSATDLESVLQMIGGQIATCTFSLGKAPPDPSNIAVYGDGTKIQKDPTNGWDYGTGMTSVELHGTTCDAVKAKTIKTVQAVFGCPGQIIP
ncbi:MAG TPA: vWA domain-containing protein [Polyangia bacterium]|nr:vWA domain-containing protein [Polyangia bacterium]